MPPPSSLKAVMGDRGNAGAVAFLVSVGDAPRSVRVSLTLPEDVLAEIDRYAGRHGLSRSRLLAQAAKYAIERQFADA